MNRLAQQARAAFEMQQSLGAKPTAERITNYLRAQMLGVQRTRQFSRLGLKGVQERAILGSKMLLDPAKSGLDRDLLLDGIREPVATGYVMNILRPEDVVLEIGANIGYYALIESMRCQKIYAAEPHPENFHRLQENIALNKADNVEAFNIALGETNDPILMQCSDLSNWHTCKDVDAESEGVIKVEGWTVDAFTEGKLSPTFMKMDVEGYELQVLRGAPKTLRKLSRLFIEIHGDILKADEIREVLDMIAAADLKSSLIIQYDRPGMSKIYPADHLEQIYAGDRGTYELFFERA